ncbi:hypothetical protein VNO80_33794 [Phaseolus coccineus]|uniref:Uncharacterized protein n=1 Tax=Phaseolus coccineus TaxID=3886 RepID=A0AAN9KY27_PHACN
MRISDSTCTYHSTFFLGEPIENSRVSTFDSTRWLKESKLLTSFRAHGNWYYFAIGHRIESDLYTLGALEQVTYYPHPKEVRNWDGMRARGSTSFPVSSTCGCAYLRVTKEVVEMLKRRQPALERLCASRARSSNCFDELSFKKKEEKEMEGGAYITGDPRGSLGKAAIPYLLTPLYSSSHWTHYSSPSGCSC